jgi:hypothetical protein
MDFEADVGKRMGFDFIGEEYSFDVYEFYEWNG